MEWWRRERKRKETKEEAEAMREATTAFYTKPPRWFRRELIDGTPRSRIFAETMAIPGRRK